MDRFRLGVRTNAKKCRDLKQTRRYKLDKQTSGHVGVGYDDEN